jgi:RNA polymerase sigma-70 factor, ECF subfamily
MSSSTTPYVPGLGRRIESSETNREGLSSSRIQEGKESPQSRLACDLAQTTRSICAPSVHDEALMELICKGDQEALASLFRRYARVVRGVALRILKDSSEADDLLQDIFVLIHRLCRTFDSSKASAEFWILQMTHRRAISRRRYLNARHFYTRVELDEQAGQLPESKSGPFDDSGDHILAELDLQKMFGTLSEDQQKTLRLHFIEGYTLDEIAKMLGQTEGNVRHHSFRGLERLRKQIFGSKLPGARAV